MTLVDSVKAAGLRAQGANEMATTTYTVICYATDGRQCRPTTSTFAGTLNAAKGFIDAAIDSMREAGAGPFAPWSERFGAWSRDGAAYGWQIEEVTS